MEATNQAQLSRDLAQNHSGEHEQSTEKQYGNRNGLWREEPQDFLPQKNYQIVPYFTDSCSFLQNPDSSNWQCPRSVFLGNTSFMEKNAILRICSSPCFSNMKTFTIDKGTGKDTREIPKHLKTVYHSNCTADSRKAIEAFEQKHFKANS